MKSYSPASDDVRSRVNALLDRYYPDLLKAEVRVDLIWADNDGDGPAVSHGGYPAYAVVKVLAHKDRAMGRGDAEIVIDREQYQNMDAEEQDALLDHELYHLELVREGTVFKVDAGGRPRMTCKKHDRQFGWFDAVARRHGKHAIEVKQATHLISETGQLYFNLGDKRREKKAEAA